MKKTIFILDHKIDGHHDFYNYLLIEALLKENYLIHFITSRQIQNSLYFRKWKELYPNLKLFFFKAKSIGNRAYPWQLMEIHDLINHFKPVHLYVQMIEGLHLWLFFSYLKNGARCFNTPWSAIHFFPTRHYSHLAIKSDRCKKPRYRIKDAIKWLNIKIISQDPNLKSIHLFDEFSVRYYNKFTKRPVFKLLADPVPHSFFDDNYKIIELRSQTGLRKEDYIYLGYGYHNRKKGTDILLRAFKKLKDDDKFERAKLAIVGPLSDDRIISILKQNTFRNMQKNGYLIVEDRHVDQQESLYYFRTSDCVCVPYRDHLGSTSSVLLRALVMSKQVISTDQNMMGFFLKKRGIGVTCKQNDVNSLYQAMKKAYENRHLLVDEFKNKDFFRSANFQKGLLENLKV